LTKKTGSLNTASIHFGQVSKVLEFKESQLSEPIDLSDDQISEITQIGRDLASKKSYYAADEDDLEDSDANTSQIIRFRRNQEDKYQIRVHNAIGVVSLTDLTLHVHPKIPLNHFAHLAHRAYEAPRSHKNPIEVANLEAFRDVLAQWCISSIESLMIGGLISEYRDKTENLSVVRGRAEPRLTTTNYLRGRLAANCTFDELDIDNSLNRILKAALNAIDRSKVQIDPEVRRRARNLQRRMSNVGTLVHHDLKVNLERHSQHYFVALDLSRRVIGSLGIDINSGATGGESFLIPTPGLVEAAILSILKKNLAPLPVNKHRKIMNGNSNFSINPDIIFENGTVTGDVKYKISESTWVRNDVAQAAMFASGYDAKAAVILSFAEDKDLIELKMDLGQLQLHRITWQASEHVKPIDAEEEFVARMRSFILPFQLT
jgi:5-methylcytosine-specific restriction enzyme subunit McrC